MHPIPLFGLIWTFLQTCACCPKGMTGTCAWVIAHQLHDYGPPDGSYDRRAAVAHAAAGLPCDKQIPYYQLIALIDDEFRRSSKPADCRELNFFLSELSSLYGNLDRLPGCLKAVYKDAVPGAIHHLLGLLDYFYIRQYRDILPLILIYFPDYCRQDAIAAELHVVYEELLFFCSPITLIDTAYATPLFPKEPDPEVHPHRTPSSKGSASVARQKAFIEEKCHEIRSKVGGEALLKTNGYGLWRFYGNATQYAYLALLLYKSLGMESISWATFTRYVELADDSPKTARKMASVIKNGKVKSLAGVQAIAEAFPEIDTQSVLKGPREK